MHALSLRTARSLLSLNQAAKYGGRLLLHDENAAGSLVGTWTAVGADEIKTTKETYVDAMTRFATRELGHATATGVAVAVVNAGGAGMQT